MSMGAVDAVAREAVEQASRRKSILAMGLAVLAAGAANAGVTGAKKKGTDCKKKEKQRCSRDAATCKPLVASNCGMLSPAGCLALQNCCDECSANGLMTCFVGVLGASVEAFA